VIWLMNDLVAATAISGPHMMGRKKSAFSWAMVEFSLLTMAMCLMAEPCTDRTSLKHRAGLWSRRLRHADDDITGLESLHVEERNMPGLTGISRPCRCC